MNALQTTTHLRFPNGACAEANAWEKLEAIRDQALHRAHAAGFAMGRIQVVVSIRTVADVDYHTDRKRQTQGKPLRDPQAQLVKKRKRHITYPTGAVETEDVQYLGYKCQFSPAVSRAFSPTLCRGE